MPEAVLDIIEKPAPAPVRACMTLLNETGDITITWTDEEDSEVRAMVAKKMEQGYSFWVVERPSWWKEILGAKAQQVRVTDISQLKRGERSVVLADKDVEALFEQGKVGVVKSMPKHGEVETTRRARTVQDVMTNNTLAIRPIAGG